jgi:hypothetical protein
LSQSLPLFEMAFSSSHGLIGHTRRNGNSALQREYCRKDPTKAVLDAELPAQSV